MSLESLLESLLERAQNLVFPTSPLLAPSFVFFFFFFEEEEEEEEEEEADDGLTPLVTPPTTDNVRRSSNSSSSGLLRGVAFTILNLKEGRPSLFSNKNNS